MKEGGKSILSMSLLFTEKEKINLKKSSINVKCNMVLVRRQSCLIYSCDGASLLLQYCLYDPSLSILLIFRLSMLPILCVVQEKGRSRGK